MKEDCTGAIAGEIYKLVYIRGNTLRIVDSEGRYLCACPEKWELVEEAVTASKPKWTLNKTLTRSDGVEITETIITIESEENGRYVLTIPEARLLQAKLRASLEAWNKHFN